MTNEPMLSQGITGNEPMLTVDPDMPARNYAQAVAYLNAGRNPDNRPYPSGRSETNRVVRTDQGVGVELHGTIVVEYLPDCVVLNTGGWQSHTTKTRINETLHKLGFTLYQRNFVWYVASHGDWDNPVMYEDGMRLSYTGEFLSESPDAERYQRFVDERHALVESYLNDFVQAIRDGEEIGEPSNGDCWACLMGLTSDDHILIHLEERYYVPSMLVTIAQEMPTSIMGRHVLYQVMTGEVDTDDSLFDLFVDQFVRSAMRNWLRRQVVNSDMYSRWEG